MLVPPLAGCMLEFNRGCTVFQVRKSTGPCETELPLDRLFISPGKLFDIVNRLLPEVRGKIVNHPVNSFCRGHGKIHLHCIFIVFLWQYILFSGRGGNPDTSRTTISNITIGGIFSKKRNPMQVQSLRNT
jgi:hypothetical protein